MSGRFAWARWGRWLGYPNLSSTFEFHDGGGTHSQVMLDEQCFCKKMIDKLADSLHKENQAEGEAQINTLANTGQQGRSICLAL
jgi:hypothetical protein